MYLKEIVATGFKSFADKMSITLNDQITCIVGPNGSGKSNVVDAVRWVLGEQSVKSLRGDGSMSDVIFSGSKSRNPLNVASVSLVFDNSDHYLKVPYTEVSIKRRVYRTGENEYFLNGEKCRLKDITDLLMDSGIGKESFNIISQGEVQRILSNSPYDRRIIFEEAAGVLKYKKRKEEALRKLDRTHQNLDRVNDIISELEVQVEPLREQSRQAKEYLENKEGLEKYEVATLAFDIEEMNEIYQKTKKNLDQLEHEILTFSNQTASKDAKLVQQKNDLMHLEQQLEEAKQNLLQMTQEVEKLNGERQMLKERSKYDRSNELVHQNIRSLKEEEGKLQSSLSVLETEFDQLQKQLEQLREESNTLSSQWNQLKNKKEVLEREYSYQDRELVRLSHQKEVLKQEIENGGGLPNSVKAVLNHPKLNGIHNCIGHLLEVEDQYAKALEIAIASSKYFIVVDDETAGKEAILYLKENQLGRATFFPLSVIRPKGIDPETLEVLKQQAAFVDVLANLVTFDSKYRNVIFNQLGNVIVVTTLEEANQISRKIQNRYKIITLDGDVIHVGGSMTGGTYYASKSIITLKQEEKSVTRKIEDLRQSFTQQEQEQSNIQEAMSRLEEKQLQQKQEETRQMELVRQKNEAYLELKNRLEEVKKELSSLELVVGASLDQEEERVLALYYEKEKEKEKLTTEIKGWTKEQEKLKALMEEEEASDKLHNAMIRKKEQEVKELEIQLGKMDVKLDAMLKILSEDYSLTFEKARTDYPLDIEIEEARKKVVTYRANMKRLGMVNLAAIEEFERVNTRYEFLTNQKNDLWKAQDTLLEIMSEMDEVMKEEFGKTFRLIETEFKQVFKELFHGGNATLKLTDPDNLLETGVDIIASPPGKKLTTISLLSGGEKTLTAISLLFAILNVRTVPFCLFDEVEAALDEANVDQFGKYLDHYKSKTQFLLITHKKKTMEYADTLYGITMQESGVSKLVSVRLGEDFH